MFPDGSSATVPASPNDAATRAESANASILVVNVLSERSISLESCTQVIVQPNGADDGPVLVIRTT